MNAIEEIVSGPFPVFVRVNGWAVDAMPVVWLPNAKVDGVKEAIGAVPVPARVATCGEPGAESITVKVAGREPVATGVNVTETLQVANEAKLPPQVVVLE